MVKQRAKISIIDFIVKNRQLLKKMYALYKLAKINGLHKKKVNRHKQTWESLLLLAGKIKSDKSFYNYSELISNVSEFKSYY